jgi:hypothetical protein
VHVPVKYPSNCNLTKENEFRDNERRVYRMLNRAQFETSELVMAILPELWFVGPAGTEDHQQGLLDWPSHFPNSFSRGHWPVKTPGNEGGTKIQRLEYDDVWSPKNNLVARVFQHHICTQP